MQHIEYQAHVRDKGWLDPVPDGSIAGTVHQNRALEAIRITSYDIENTAIQGYVHVQDIGWNEQPIPQTQDVGTTGLGKHIEAVRFELTGDHASEYTLWYRLHISNMGFMAWSRNGEVNGTVGAGLQAEAIQMVLVRNDENFWNGTDFADPFVDLTPKPQPVNKAEDVLYHAQKWVGYISEGGSNYSVFGEGDWCCKFVRGIYQALGLPFPNTDWVPTVVDWAIQNGRWTSTPQPGYAVIFDFNENGSGDHIGFVKEVYSSNHVLTVEGNTDQGQGIGVYNVDRSSFILGYVNPF